MDVEEKYKEEKAKVKLLKRHLKLQMAKTEELEAKLKQGETRTNGDMQSTAEDAKEVENLRERVRELEQELAAKTAMFDVEREQLKIKAQNAAKSAREADQKLNEAVNEVKKTWHKLKLKEDEAKRLELELDHLKNFDPPPRTLPVEPDEDLKKECERLRDMLSQSEQNLKQSEAAFHLTTKEFATYRQEQATKVEVMKSNMTKINEQNKELLVQLEQLNEQYQQQLSQNSKNNNQQEEQQHHQILSEEEIKSLVQKRVSEQLVGACAQVEKERQQLLNDLKEMQVEMRELKQKLACATAQSTQHDNNENNINSPHHINNTNPIDNSNNHNNNNNNSTNDTAGSGELVEALESLQEALQHADTLEDELAKCQAELKQKDEGIRAELLEHEDECRTALSNATKARETSNKLQAQSADFERKCHNLQLSINTLDQRCDFLHKTMLKMEQKKVEAVNALNEEKKTNLQRLQHLDESAKKHINKLDLRVKSLTSDNEKLAKRLTEGAQAWEQLKQRHETAMNEGKVEHSVLMQKYQELQALHEDQSTHLSGFKATIASLHASNMELKQKLSERSDSSDGNDNHENDNNNGDDNAGKAEAATTESTTKSATETKPEEEEEKGDSGYLPAGNSNNKNNESTSPEQERDSNADNNTASSSSSSSAPSSADIDVLHAQIRDLEQQLATSQEEYSKTSEELSLSQKHENELDRQIKELTQRFELLEENFECEQKEHQLAVEGAQADLEEAIEQVNREHEQKEALLVNEFAKCQDQLRETQQLFQEFRQETEAAAAATKDCTSPTDGSEGLADSSTALAQVVAELQQECDEVKRMNELLVEENMHLQQVVQGLQEECAQLKLQVASGAVSDTIAKVEEGVAAADIQKELEQKLSLLTEQSTRKVSDLNTELETLQNRMEEVQDQCNTEKEKLETQISTMQKEKAGLEADLAQSQAAETLANTRIQELEDTCKNFEQTLEKQANKVSDMDSQYDQLGKEVSDLEASKIELETKLEQTLQQVEQYQADGAKQSGELYTAKNEIAIQKSKVTELEQEIVQKTAEIERKLNQAVSEKEAEIAKITGQKETQIAKILNEKKTEVSALSNRVNELETQLTTSNKERDQLKSELEEGLAKISQLNNVISTEATSKAELQSTLNKTRADLDQANTNNTQAQATIDELRIRLNALELEMEGVTVSLQAANEGLLSTRENYAQLKGLHSTLKTRSKQQSAKIDKLKTSVEQLSARCDQTSAELEQCQEERDKLSTQLTETTEQYQLDNTSLKERLEVSTTKNQAAEEENHAHVAAIHKLCQIEHQLRQQLFAATGSAEVTSLSSLSPDSVLCEGYVFQFVKGVFSSSLKSFYYVLTPTSLSQYTKAENWKDVAPKNVISMTGLTVASLDSENDDDPNYKKKDKFGIQVLAGDGKQAVLYCANGSSRTVWMEAFSNAIMAQLEMKQSASSSSSSSSSSSTGSSSSSSPSARRGSRRYSSTASPTKSSSSSSSSSLGRRSGAVAIQHGGAFFGKSLDQVARRDPFSSSPSSVGDQDGIPLIVFNCIEYLKKHGLSTVGLFRVSADKQLILDLKEAFDAGATVNLDDPHATAGVLKLYLRSLPEPVIPMELYDRFVDAGETKGGHGATVLADVCNNMPALNRNLLVYLIDFVRLLAAQSKINKMDSKNCAVIFAPNLLRPPAKGPLTLNQALAGAKREVAAVRVVIEHMEQVFPDKADCFTLREHSA